MSLRTPNPRLSISRGGCPLLAIGPIIFREHPDFQCTFWHVETVMKKVAVLLGHSKKPLP